MKKNFFNDKTKKKIKEKKFYIVLALCFLTISAIAFTNSITEKPKAPAENKNSDVKYALPEPIDEPVTENENITQTFPPQIEITVEDTDIEENSEKETEISTKDEKDTDYKKNTSENKTNSDEKNEFFPADAKAQKPLRKITQPVPGTILLPYSKTPSYQKTTEDWRTHEAIDYEAAAGSEVAAAGSGKILKITDSGLYGASITIDHENTMKTIYSNVRAADSLKEGDFVTTGDIIGIADNTSLCEKHDKNHIHFEVMVNGKNIDPAQWLE